MNENKKRNRSRSRPHDVRKQSEVQSSEVNVRADLESSCGRKTRPGGASVEGPKVEKTPLSRAGLRPLFLARQKLTGWRMGGGIHIEKMGDVMPASA